MKTKTRLMRIGAGLFAAALVFSTCSGPLDPRGDESQPSQPQEPSTPLIPTNPLNVAVTLDTASRIEKTVDADGDALQLVDGHGNVVTLLIPEDAVVEETISMTLVSSLSGATLSGGLLVGVDLKPDGLQLRRPASLVIEPSDPEVISQLLDESSEFLLTAFSYHRTGADFHYYPYRIVGDEIHLLITHFSGYGSGASTQGDRTAQHEYIPTDANARASQRIAETTTEEARKQHADPDYDPTQTIMEAATEALRTWLYESVLPMAEEAETNDRMLDCAVIEWLRWEAYGLVVGVIENGSPFEPERARIRTSIRKGSANAIEKSHQRAVQNNDASEIERFLYLWAETQLMFDDDVVDDLDDRLMRITRFELEMESTISCTAGSFGVGVKVPRLPLVLDEEQLFFSKGSGPIGHTDAWMECMISFSGTGSTFDADYAVIGIPPYDHPDCGGRRMARPTPDLSEPGVSMYVGQGLPIETFVLQCEGSDIPFPFTSPLWAGGFAVLHQPNYVDSMGYHIGEWDMNLAQPYATKSFDHADDNVHESATYTLWYAPLP